MSEKATRPDEIEEGKTAEVTKDGGVCPMSKRGVHMYLKWCAAAKASQIIALLEYGSKLQQCGTHVCFITVRRIL